MKGSMVLSHALAEPNRAVQWLETIGLMRQTYVSLILRCPSQWSSNHEMKIPIFLTHNQQNVSVFISAGCESVSHGAASVGQWFRGKHSKSNPYAIVKRTI